MENQLVIEGLRVKLAEIQAAIRMGERRLKALASDKDTISRALAIMGSDTGEGAVSLGIASGTFTRTILELIRDAESGAVCPGDRRDAGATGRQAAGQAGV
jgi:hypothetical protein